MPQQLIYTSAPRGVVAGRSGYCTVARSAAMRDALMLQLEKFCYYQHLSLAGGRERPIFAARMVDIRGTRFHVLSRIQDAGLDFTGRTNFIAHHLVFTPEEIRQFPAPPVIFGYWPGWLRSWAKEPQLLENETWAELAALNDRAMVPAQTWQQVTGDAANGYGLLEARAGATFRVDDLTDATALDLFAESLALLEVRDPRRDSRTAAWNYTFTTSMQEQDNPTDFRWRCLHADNPAATRFITPDCRALSAVRVVKCTEEEAAFARAGRQAPVFYIEPQDLQIVEGLPAHFSAKAVGVPSPAYQWFVVDRTEKEQPMAGETNAELVITNPPLGVSRYMVSAANSTGEVASRAAKLSVEERASRSGPSINPRMTKTAIPQRSEADIARQRQKLAVEMEGEQSRAGLGNTWLVLGGCVLGVILLAALGVYVWTKNGKPLAKAPAAATNAVGQAPMIATAPSSNVPALSQPASPPGGTAKTGGPVMFSQTPVPLPPAWKAGCIGVSPVPTAPLYDHHSFLLTSTSGKLSAGETEDDFFFAGQPWSNSGNFSAQSLLAGTLGNTTCGIMLRASVRADAAFVFIGTVNSNIVWIQRSTSGAPATQTIISQTEKSLYLNLVCRGADISANISNDGERWYPAGSTTDVDFGGPQGLLGFAICSADAKSVQAVFNSVTINGQPQ